MLESALRFVCDRNKIFLKDVMALKSSLKTGTGWQYIDFDPDADNGKGLPIVKNIPWQYIYIDPAATEIDEASFVGIKFPIRIEEAKRKFPKFADEITTGDSEGLLGSKSRGGVREDRANYVTDRPQKDDKAKLDGMVILEEAWLRDYKMVKVTEDETIEEIKKETEEFFKGENPDINRHQDHVAHYEAHEAQKRSIAAEALGVDPASITDADIEALREDPHFGIILNMIDDHNKIHQEYHKINPKGERPKYNSGLRLVMKIGKTIVYDGESPVDDGKVPLVPWYCYKDEDSIYAMGEIEQILPIQKSFNEMDDAEYQALKLTGNPQWKMSSDCGIKPSDLTNKVGQVYSIKPGTMLERIQPAVISSQLEQRKVNDLQAMQILTGQNEASQGRQPGGVTAARAIEALQAQTNGRYRLKSSAYAMYSKQRAGELIAARIVKYWTTERYLRIHDDSTGETIRVVFSPDDVKDLEYEIRVTPGALAGIDKQGLYDVMSTFVDKGMISPKTFFQVVDVPHKQKILEELAATDQLTQQAQALAQENEQLKQFINGAQQGAPAGQAAPQQAPVA
jgi:hypothetical protein